MIKEKAIPESTSQIAKNRNYRSLKSPKMLEDITNVFREIWTKSKNPNYVVNFTTAMKKLNLHWVSIDSIKRKAIQLRILVSDGKNVRFRSDLAEPSVLMITNILNTKLQSDHKKEIKLSDEELVKELRSRGYKVSCEKTIKIEKVITL